MGSSVLPEAMQYMHINTVYPASAITALAGGNEYAANAEHERASSRNAVAGRQINPMQQSTVCFAVDLKGQTH